MLEKFFLYNAFLRHFLPKNRIMPSGQRAHPLGDQKSLYAKSCVLWFVTAFVLKKCLCNAFLRHFSPKNRIDLSGQRSHPWADFAHMQYRPRFLSYKITYQIWLSKLNYFLSYGGHRQTHTHTHTHTQTDRQTDRHTHRRYAKNNFLGFSGPQNVNIHQNLEVDFLGKCNTLYFV